MIFRRGAIGITDSMVRIVELDDILRDAIPGSDVFREIVVSSFAASQISASVMPNASSVDITGLALNILDIS
jgi:hypothetical protein